MSVLNDRRERSQDRLDLLKRQLSKAEAIAGDKACVYVTGSFGRAEASMHSDLDLFIVGRTCASGAGEVEEPARLLSRLDEILLKSALITAQRTLGFPEFSGDGEYLQHYTVDALVKTLGKPHDDARNTFTARLLLLLESKPLIGKDVYDTAIMETVLKYWRDFAGREANFVPAFFANDILRLWRTFCVNYEARTDSEPEDKKAKRKLKNYKLKHSRLLTCYSALAHLLAVFTANGTVRPADVVEMVRLTPTERLGWVREQSVASRARDDIDRILECYSRFLTSTDASEVDLVARMKDPSEAKRYFESANELGEAVYSAIGNIDDRNSFRRLLTV